jgi:hypothetical protein
MFLVYSAVSPINIQLSSIHYVSYLQRVHNADIFVLFLLLVLGQKDIVSRLMGLELHTLYLANQGCHKNTMWHGIIMLILGLSWNIPIVMYSSYGTFSYRPMYASTTYTCCWHGYFTQLLSEKLDTSRWLGTISLEVLSTLEYVCIRARSLIDNNTLPILLGCHCLILWN